MVMLMTSSLRSRRLICTIKRSDPRSVIQTFVKFLVKEINRSIRDKLLRSGFLSFPFTEKFLIIYLFNFVIVGFRINVSVLSTAFTPADSRKVRLRRL